MSTLLIVFGILVRYISLVEALRNITIDNTSPLVVFSPTPCFQQNTTNCSPEWQLVENDNDFNGSTTTTTGPDIALGLTVVPRVSLTFQGVSILFVPGQNSTAQVTVVVDNLSSVLVNTASNAFSGTGFDPSTNHTITVTFVPSILPTTLEVDYFLIGLPDANTSTSTSATSSTFTPTPIPTVLPSTTANTSTPLPTSLPSTTTPQHFPTHTQSPIQSSALPTGTIAAIALSAALFLLLALLALLITLRRRRRRAALQREKAILYDLRLPSSAEGNGDGNGNNHHYNRTNTRLGGGPPGKQRISISRIRSWGRAHLDRLRGRGQDRDRDRDRIERGEGRRAQQAEVTELPWEGAQRPGREKGKERERDSVLPPVHYTPRR